MSRNEFNGAGNGYHEYTVKLRPDCGGRGCDDDPLSQAAAFRAKLSEWLGLQGLKTSGAVKKTETVGPSAEGYPQIRITATEEAFAAIQKKFGHIFKGVTETPSKPAPGSLYPPDKNCWDPRPPKV